MDTIMNDCANFYYNPTTDGDRYQNEFDYSYSDLSIVSSFDPDDLFSIAKKLLSTFNAFIFADRLYLFSPKANCHQPVTQISLLYFTRKLGLQVSPSEAKKILDICLSFQKHRVTEFPVTPDCIAFSNGVFDARTGRFHKNCREHRSVFSLQANYNETEDENNTANLFFAFLTTISNGDKECARRIYDFLAYSMLPGNPGKYCFLLGPAPNSGRTTLLELLRRLLGGHAVSALSVDSLGKSKNIDNLIHSQINICSSVTSAHFTSKTISGIRSLVSGNFSQSSGYPSFCARARPILVFEPSEQLHLNYFHEVDWDHLVVVPFVRSIKRKKLDPYLIERLWAERDQIGTILAHAAHKIVKRRYRFNDCSAATKYKAEIFSNSIDVVDKFISDRCELDGKSCTFFRDIKQSFENYCRDNFFTPVSDNKLSRILHERYHLQNKKWASTGQSTTIRGYIGIRLLE